MEIIQDIGNLDLGMSEKKKKKLNLENKEAEKKEEIKVNIVEDIKVKEDDYNV